MRDFIINTGISESTTHDILDDFDWSVKQFKPQIVSVMIGSNDCSTFKNISLKDFEDNMNSLLTLIMELNAVPILQTQNVIITEKAKERERLSDYDPLALTCNGLYYEGYH
jgi:acyl-CoA thioesterase I